VALVVGLCTAISELLVPFLDRTSAVTIYLIGVVYVALRMGQAAATLAVVLSILAFDLLFVEPRWSFAPLDPQYYLTFLVMLVVGVLIGRLVAQASLQAELAEARARRAQALSDLTGRLVAARSPAELADALSRALQSTFGVPCELLLPDAHGRLHPQGAQTQPPSLASPLLVRQAQAQLDGMPVSQTTAPLDARAPLLLPLQGKLGPLGVLVVQPPVQGIGAPEDRQLLDAMADQLALALERTLFERRSAAAALEAETERLRSTLLSSISHDFRTPLTTIIGAASSLIEQDQAFDAPRRRLLLEGLLEEARRVHASMSDLLDLTRMEEGQLQPLCEWCPADDLLQEVRDALGPRTADHAFEAGAPEDAIVWCDPRLIVQATVNLLVNALRHTPAGGRVRLRIEVGPSEWTLRVADSGPGLPPGQEQAIFKKFARARGDSRDGGTGLGLAICAAVARLHQGRVEAHNAGGAVFTMTLPQPATQEALAGDTD
jgi:two-component system sensor histidine kinase KdpD